MTMPDEPRQGPRLGLVSTEVPVASQQVATYQSPGILHYGWLVVVAAVFSIFVCLGIGRFALGMLLPTMGDALILNYVQMGWISSANFVGYLLGALWARRLIGPIGERRLITMSLILIVATMLGVAVSGNIFTLIILYGCTGLGSGIAMVCTLALLPHWFAPQWRGRAIGYLSIGMGLAIMLAGWSIPKVNAELGLDGWRAGWSGLAVLCLPLILFCLLVVRNRPMDLGLAPFGGIRDVGDFQIALGAVSNAAGGSARRVRRALVRLGLIYFLFGATYVVYTTFFVTTLVLEQGLEEAEAGRFWIWLGGCSLLCGPLLGSFSDRMGRRAGIALSLAMQAAAFGAITYGDSEIAVYTSVILFGLSAFSVPLIMSATVADYASPERTAAIIGTITVVFGIGQLLGPVVAGAIAEYAESFTPAYLVSAALVTLALAIALTLPDPPS